MRLNRAREWARICRSYGFIPPEEFRNMSWGERNALVFAINEAAKRKK